MNGKTAKKMRATARKAHLVASRVVQAADARAMRRAWNDGSVDHHRKGRPGTMLEKFVQVLEFRNEVEKRAKEQALGIRR